MSEFLDEVEQQLSERGHQWHRDNGCVSTAVAVNGVFSKMCFKDIKGEMAVCTLELVGLSIPAEMKSAMVELVSLLNNGIVFTTAIYDASEASLGSRGSIPILKGANIVNVVELLIVNVSVTAKMLMATAMPVLAGIMSPSQSIALEASDPGEHLRRCFGK